MARKRIGVLYEYWWDDEESRGEGGRPRRQPPEQDVREVYDALRKNGYAPVYMRVDGTRQSLSELGRSKSNLVFNLVEAFGGDDTQERHVAGFLEMLKVPFTGAGSDGLHIAQDKALAKKIFAFHGIHTPYFATVYRGRSMGAMDVQFPVIVKPTREDGSIGIHFGAVCRSIKDLMERIDFIHAQFDSPALIEEYIEGRELYVGVLGNDDPEALPIVEIDLSKVPDGMPKIAGTEVKWDTDSEVYHTTPSFLPDDLDHALVTRLQDTAVRAFKVCQARDYGRVDLRLTPEGTIHVLEVNPNPYLLSTAEFAMAAKKSGRGYVELIGEITELAFRRYG